MENKSLFEQEAYEECIGRIDRLSESSTPLWGKMSVAQMLAHCAEVQEVLNGKPLDGVPLIIRLLKPLVRRAIISPKPYPKNSGTHPQYLQNEPRIFADEKKRLMRALADAFQRAAAGTHTFRHPLFGSMTRAESGWSMYKHLDHHLRQFGV